MQTTVHLVASPPASTSLSPYESQVLSRVRGLAVDGVVPSDHYAVGVDLNCTHHRGARSGLVTGVATPVHRGRSTATYEIVISDEEGRRVCSARLTCLLRDVKPGDGIPAGAAS